MWNRNEFSAVNPINMNIFMKSIWLKIIVLNAINVPRKFYKWPSWGNLIKLTCWREAFSKGRLHCGGMSDVGIQRAGRKFVAYG